jgi:hypothetical protein
MSEPSKDATAPNDIPTPKIVTDVHAPTNEVREDVRRLVAEGEAAGISPVKAPRTATALHPRDHLPQYEGKMRGELPDDHPARKRQMAEYKAMRRREKERDDAVKRIEATVPQKIELGSKVVIGDNAKVDYEDENGVRVKGHYGGIEGEVYQTYVDTEGVRRHIIIDRDPETGRSRYAPVSVREGDLKEISTRREGGGRRFHPVPMDPEARATRDAAERQRRATMSQEEIERATYGGLTARELADKMCGL